MKILIGSSALKRLGFDVKTTDTDYFYLEGEPRPDGDSHALPPELFNLLLKYCIKIEDDLYYTSKCALYTIKESHLEWDIFWFKHAFDVIMLQRNGAYRLDDLYFAFKDFWKKAHGYKTRLSLDRSKDDFFNDAVVKKYDHDWLHEVVARPNPPLYTLALSDNAEVMIDRVKFDKLMHSQKLNMFREEMCVIALERWVIPSEGKIHPALAYLYAVQKTITNLTKNWASQFILDNLHWYLSVFDRTFYNNYLEATDQKKPSFIIDGELEVVQQRGNNIVQYVFQDESGNYYKSYGMLDRRNVVLNWECFDWLIPVKPVTKTISVYEEVTNSNVQNPN